MARDELQRGANVLPGDSGKDRTGDELCTSEGPLRDEPLATQLSAETGWEQAPHSTAQEGARAQG